MHREVGMNEDWILICMLLALNCPMSIEERSSVRDRIQTGQHNMNTCKIRFQLEAATVHATEDRDDQSFVAMKDACCKVAWPQELAQH